MRRGSPRCNEDPSQADGPEGTESNGTGLGPLGKVLGRDPHPALNSDRSSWAAPMSPSHPTPKPGNWS